MSNEIGRNDKCPCMSGKKYKKCCYKNQEFVDFFKTKLNAQYIDMDYIINNLIINSSIMHNYLIENLNKLKKPIVWLYNPNLDANMRSLYLQDFYAIIIKNIPIHENDYFDVAHEIGHLILGEKGYPMCEIIDEDKNKTYLGTILTNTILDPKINKEIIKYGFNFPRYIDKGIRIQIPLINRYPSENMLHKYDKHFLKCLLIEKILEWDLIKSNIVNPFDNLYKSKYPILYNEVIKEVDYIRKTGYDTPEKARLILEKILQKNEMHDVLNII